MKAGAGGRASATPAGTVLHYLLSTRFVFDAGATDKAQARLFGEFALSGLAGMAITALVIALTATLGPAAAAGQGAGRGVSFLVVFALRRCVVFAGQGRV